MDIKSKLAELREKQQQLSRDYDAVVKEYESSDFVNENRTLKREAEECHRELSKVKEELAGNIRENERLRLALQEQIFNERLNILKVSGQKLRTYFEDRNSGYQNSLAELEAKTKDQLAKLSEKARKQLAQGQTEFAAKVAELTAELERQLQYQAEEFRKAEEDLWRDAKNRMDQMGGEELPPEVVQKRIKQNQIEMKIGLEWVNRIGILLILFGVGAAFQYSFAHWMNDYVKGISFFIFGGLFLLGGEWCFQRKKEVFAKGLIGGGIAILYGSIFYSFFLLKIIPLETGMVMSVLVTLTTVVLSLRYNSKTICTVGLLGGFLPFISYVAAFGLTGPGFAVSMGYLFVLNLTILLISFGKRWVVVNYISFTANIPALIYLIFGIPDWRIGLVYIIGTFLMYLTVTLAYPILHKISLKNLDVVLIGLNTSASSLIVFILLQKEGLMQYRGLAALLFGLAYLGLGRLIQKVLTREKGTLVLFYSAALTFAVLAIPFQFGVKWLALGWLIEAVLLIVYGFQIGVKPMEKAGWGIFALCLGAFGLCDFLPALLDGNSVQFFDFKYFMVIAGQLTITAYYLLQIIRNRISRFDSRGGNIIFFKNFTLLSLLIYLIFMFTKSFEQWAPPELKSGFYYCVFLALILIGLGYGLSKVQIIADGFVRGFTIFLYLAGDIICVGLNLLFPVWRSFSANEAARYWAVGILIVYNIYVFFNVRDLFIKYIRKNNGNFEMVPMLAAVFLLGNVTAFLIVQFQLSTLNLFISFVYLALAIGYIGYGFVRKFAYIRRFGLGLTLFSTAKLFIYDLSFLESTGRIIAYFGFGLILLAISFIYQKVKNNLEGNHDSKAV